LNSAKIALMANLSRNGSDALTEVHNPDNLNYDLFNQSVQIMTSSEQSNDVSQSETDITSDSNIIPYSQYLSETHQETVQNSNSSAQQDVLILSMFDQLTTQKNKMLKGAKSDEDATYEEDQGNEAVEDTNTDLDGRDDVMTDVILPQVQATQEIEDTHVTLTPVNPDGQQ
ncbi:hypothetical protein Tco_0131962, partial [Tanacetum coccineum]